MTLSDLMSRDVECVTPEDDLCTAAAKMRDRDIGFIPVCEGKKVQGVITDRDIVVRCIAERKDPSRTAARDVMSSKVCVCRADDDIHEAATRMEEAQVRRILVLDRDDNVIGVVSMGDLVSALDNETVAEVLEGVSEPASTHALH